MRAEMRLVSLFFFLVLQAQVYAQVGSENRNNLYWDTLSFPQSEYGWEKGMKVPNIIIRDINNQEFELYDLLDKPLIIDFWFIACKPCVANKKYLKRFYHQYGIEILSISVDERQSTVSRYVQENGMMWKNVHDNNSRDERFKLEIGSDNLYPLYILISETGEVLESYSGGDKIAQLGIALQGLFAN